MNPSKRKGDKAEREVEKLIGELLGIPVRRKLGAGRQDDTGDIDLVPDTVVSVANWPRDTLRAVREKPAEAEHQRLRAHARYACTFVRLRGGRYRVVLTPEQWAAYVRATAYASRHADRVRATPGRAGLGDPDEAAPGVLGEGRQHAADRPLPGD